MKTSHQDKNRGMLKLFWTLFFKLSYLFLSLRYHVTVKGLKELKDSDLKKGLLFLPNHPAHVDPLFLTLFLWPEYRMRPLVIEYISRLPLIRFAVKFLRGVLIPDFDTAVNELKVKKAEAVLGQIIEGLKNGDNFFIYPAGRLKSTGKEVIGGASGAHSVIQEMPDVPVVLIRTSGLWGSSFSRVAEGISPPLLPTLWHGIKTVFKNGIFFCPRRKVLIEIEINPENLPRQGSRIEFNRFLESWYNRYLDDQGNIQEIEPLRLVSYSFWRQDLLEILQPNKKMRGENEQSVSDETKNKIIEEIKTILQNPQVVVQDNSSLALDLGMDSLNVAELIAYITKNYDVDQLYPEDIETVQDVFEIAEGLKTVHRRERPKGEAHWLLEENRPDVILAEGDTLSEVFLNSCNRMGSLACCGDDVSGVLSYKKFKMSAIVLSRYFRKKPEKHIAVLLPASIGVYVVILALQLAGKVPVMLNWTLGAKYLEEMMSISGAKTVITSWRFLDRLAHVEFGSLIDQIEYLEDIKGHLSFKDKLYGAFLSKRSTPFILRALKLSSVKPSDPCVILFTSGTEASPKGVPLSHQNIILNQRAAMQCLEIYGTDSMYAVLPPFHSFGFSVAGLFPIFGGLKLSFYPDPTDGFALAEGIERWQSTLFCSPPGFLKSLLSAAKNQQLKTIRIFITGAEKAPEELIAKIKQINPFSSLVEGYGITECSPVLTITRMDRPHKGVGALLPGIEFCTIHVETQELLPFGSEGEVCVRGPNIFAGYLGNQKTPFIEIQGKSWYRTGDIGYLDREGELILSGRLKRFIKLGGEMISLGAVEEAVKQELLGSGQISADAPCLALCADERVEQKPLLVLFMTIPFQEETANEILRKRGFSRLVKISRIQVVDKIPLMGTGKTNYRQLQSLFTAS
jgi:long-chain-fatty-acid--[acyl-carrier-protein] ligase